MNWIAEPALARHQFNAAFSAPDVPDAGLLVNDLHSGLNATRVRAIGRPSSIADLQAHLREAREQGLAVAIAGSRHAMGGQQFAEGGLLIDMRGMNRVLGFDRVNGFIEVESGIEWPALIDYLRAAQADGPRPWTIAQKQTGADNLTIGGALASNIHGRGLAMKPIIADVEAFTLIDANGVARRCSRSENAELFRLAIGGYGLFGVIATVCLRLVPRRKVQRVVEIVEIERLMPAFAARIADGYSYGDWQYSTDSASDDFLRRGVFSCYRPVPDMTEISTDRRLSAEDWRQLLYLGHTDRRRAWEIYSSHYLATSGQVYWSDTHQLSAYLDGYHRELDARMGAAVPASEMIAELFVPRDALTDFMAAARYDCRRHGSQVIYGTVRLIERDEESFLAWARRPWACVIFNLHVVHAPPCLAKAAQDFRHLIERAIERGGGFYLTYHRWATPAQMAAAHPHFAEFLRLKRRHDPEELFQSEWYRQWRGMAVAPNSFWKSAKL